MSTARQRLVFLFSTATCVFGGMNAGAMAAAAITSPSQCPSGTTAVASGAPSEGIQFYQCVTGSAPTPSPLLQVTLSTPGSIALERSIQSSLRSQTAIPPSALFDKGESISDQDPFIDYNSIQDRGGSSSSASGTISGTTLSSRTTDVGGGIAGALNPSKTFQISGNQKLVIGGLFRYDNDFTSYGSAGNLHEDRYTLAAFARWYVGSTYFAGAVAGNLGNSHLADFTSTSTGSFGTSGVSGEASVGHVFTLFDSRFPVNPGYPTKAPMKAPPRADDGYALQLDVSGRLSYNTSRAGGYTDVSGFLWGAETEDYGSVGGRAKLYWTIPKLGYIWTPFIEASFDQQFSYSDKLAIPVQATSTGDSIFFGSVQTFGGARVGISAQAANGIIVGVQGYYKQSSQYQLTGGQAFLRYAVPVAP